MGLPDIGLARLALAWLMALIPVAAIMWYRLPMLSRSLVALLRMAVQLLFVGLYLTVVFELDRPWLTVLWLIAMIAVADLSVIRGCGLRLARVGPVLFLALLAGTLLPLLYFTGIVLARPNTFEAQYAIPLGGMVLGNCLRVDIVGLNRFFSSLREQQKPFLAALAQGATLAEAVRPYVRKAFEAALAPTVAMIATIGLVSLPGMMTGVILAGFDPIRAVKYQAVIVLAIFAGAALTLLLAFRLALRIAFDPYGLLDEGIFRGR